MGLFLVFWDFFNSFPRLPAFSGLFCKFLCALAVALQEQTRSL